MKDDMILSNAFLLLIPIFVWNALFWSKLPPEYEEKSFDRGVPKFLLILENIFRIVIFSLPLFMHIDYSTLVPESRVLHLYHRHCSVLLFMGSSD